MFLAEWHKMTLEHSLSFVARTDLIAILYAPLQRKVAKVLDGEPLQISTDSNTSG